MLFKHTGCPQHPHEQSLSNSNKTRSKHNVSPIISNRNIFNAVRGFNASPDGVSLKKCNSDKNAMLVPCTLTERQPTPMYAPAPRAKQHKKQNKQRNNLKVEKIKIKKKEKQKDSPDLPPWWRGASNFPPKLEQHLSTMGGVKLPLESTGHELGHYPTAQQGDICCAVG